MAIDKLPSLKSISIEVERLRIYAFHGVTPEEQQVGTWFEVSCSIDYPADGAVENDDLESTVNYAEIMELIKKEMALTSRLIEHIAGRIRRSLLHRFPLSTGGFVTVRKLNPPVPDTLASASVTLRW